MHQVNTVPGLQSMGSKINVYKWKKGWRAHKEDQLYIRVTGKTWQVPNPFNKICDTEESWDKDKLKKTARFCKLSIYQGVYFATKENSLQGYFGIDTDGDGDDDQVEYLFLTDCQHGK